VLLSTRAVAPADREERNLPKQSLLVVDADPRSLRILEVALRKAGFAVATAADGAEALRKVQRSPPDLVLSELNLPGQDGAALCRTLRGDSRLGGVPVLLMNADRAQPAREAALQAGADDFLVKPLLIKELLARIRVLLSQREQARNAQRGAAAALTGSVGDLGLVDLFTSLENWQKTAVVRCETGDGRTARVWVRDGQVVDAEVDPVAGEAAFYRLLTWESGSFRVEFGPVDREVRSEAGTQALLMEGMRRIDEIARMAEALPMTTVLGVDFPALASQLAEMPDELNGVLRLFDGRRNLREVLSGSPLDDLSTVAAVQRLMGDGVLVSGAAAGPPRSRPSLQQWLGSNPPPPRAAEDAAPDGATAAQSGPPRQVEAVNTPRSGQAGARATARSEADASAAADHADHRHPARAATAAAAPTRSVGRIVLVRYPPLRGTRRERLRREAEEARQAMTAGRPVRLTHVLELPPTPGGGDALPQGARRMSAAVGDAAKRFAPDMPVARVVRPWIAPGASPEVEQPPAPAAATEAPPPRARSGRAEPAPDEIGAALADAVGGTASEIGTSPLDAPAPAVVNPGAVRKLAGGAPMVLRALRPKPSEASPSPNGAAAFGSRSRTLLLIAVAGVVLVALATAALFLRRPHRDSPALPPEPAATAPAPAAAPAVSPPAATAPAEPPAPAVATSRVSPPVDPGDYARSLATGEALLKRGKYRAAVAEFRKAVELRPDSVPALLALGDAFLEGDQLRNAVKPLQQAAQLDPRSARAQLLLGTVFQGLGREKEAVLAYRRYLELEPHGEFAGDVRAIVANLSK
jgi:DNA-binding response OmpR family regulator/cytochrome c-type biogenesis protein CcmH/NrfG